MKSTFYTTLIILGFCHRAHAQDSLGPRKLLVLDALSFGGFAGGANLSGKMIMPLYKRSYLRVGGSLNRIYNYNSMYSAPMLQPNGNINWQQRSSFGTAFNVSLGIEKRVSIAKKLHGYYGADILYGGARVNQSTINYTISQGQQSATITTAPLTMYPQIRVNAIAGLRYMATNRLSINYDLTSTLFNTQGASHLVTYSNTLHPRILHTLSVGWRLGK